MLLVSIAVAIHAFGCHEGRRDAIDSVVLAEMQRQKIPGVSVAVVRDGKIVKAEGYGLANVELGVPTRADTIFQSGSVGKQFTAVAVMLAVQDGAIGLDDPITRYFPEGPETWRGITVRHLLTHTSGIPDYLIPGFDLQRDYTYEELVEVASGLELEFPPGTRWNYSNTGYLLLGILVERATGAFYGDVLSERVFAPLGMHTARVISESAIVPNRAAGYRLVDGELKNQEWVAPQLNRGADGCLYLTVLDFIAWDTGLRDGAVLSPESWAEVYTPVRLASGNTFPYGFGWDVEEQRGETVYRHGGSWQGFRAHFVRYVDSGLSVAVMANLAEARPDAIAEEIVAVLAPSLAKPEPKEIEDRDPEVTARLKHLLASGAAGTLSADQFPYARAGLWPLYAEQYQTLLSEAGALQHIALMERRVLGDDRIFSYDVAYAEGHLGVTLGLAPDGGISIFEIEPR